MPKIETKEIPGVVKAEVEKMLSRPVDELQIVHQLISDEDKEKKYIRVLVTAAPKALVKFYSAIFQRAGLQLQELETEAFALERSLIGRDQATAMVVDIGAERTNFFIIDKGLPLTHRSIADGGKRIDQILVKSLQVDPAIVPQIKKDMSLSREKIDSTAFRPVIDPIVKEVEYGFDLFLHQTGNEGKKPEKIILTGGSCVLPFFHEEIQNKFPLRVFVGDPWARTVYQDGLRQILDSLGPRMSVAIGLALRNIVE
jgi:type IV pilus assembly protein PilM